MEHLVEGPVGSGKTYYAVNYICKFSEYDTFYKEWNLRQDTLVVSNIDKLKIHHLDLTECIKKYSLEKFFTIENFEKIREKYRVKHIILIIDETQNIFDFRYHNKDVMFFFEYARHIGVDIILLTTGATKVSRGLIPQLENIVEALPRSLGLPYLFRYVVKDTKGNEQYKTSIKMDQRIFAAYRSMSANEIEKPKNVYKKLATISLVALAVMFIGISIFIKSLKAGSLDSNKSGIHGTPSQSVPVKDEITPEKVIEIVPDEKKDYADNKKSNEIVDQKRLIKVECDGAIYSEGKLVYYLINNKIVRPHMVKKYDPINQIAYYLDDNIAPEVPAGLTGGHIGGRGGAPALVADAIGSAVGAPSNSSIDITKVMSMEKH